MLKNLSAGPAARQLLFNMNSTGLHHCPGPSQQPPTPLGGATVYVSLGRIDDHHIVQKDVVPPLMLQKLILSCLGRHPAYPMSPGHDFSERSSSSNARSRACGSNGDPWRGNRMQGVPFPCQTDLHALNIAATLGRREIVALTRIPCGSHPPSSLPHR